MVIDFHVHTFPREIRENREKFLPGEPAFALLYESHNAKLVSADEIVATMDEQGVDKSVVFGFPWRNPDTVKLNNDHVLEAVTRFPDRLMGFCCLDPFIPFAVKEVERCLDAGLCGVGELAFYRSGIDADCLDALDPIMAICLERHLPVMIHTNEPVGHVYPGKTPNTLAQIYAMVRRFAENKLVLAHWGGGIFLYSLLKKEVRESLANVWYDTAASPFLYDPKIYRQALELAGPDKVLFGTDFPLLKPARYFKEMDTAGLSESEKAAVCGGNALALING
ncbi:MAG: amidohydrolase [Desulfobacterales bacterium]|nr:amidohydrolase [Desulfobacterales bacterium]